MLAAGTRLGPFEIGPLLGVGGMGEVYRARDERLGRDVAIKVLPAVVALDSERRARFQREARVLATLNHPNIAAIYGAEEHAGCWALVLELVSGETLADVVQRGPMSPGEVRGIALQLIDALDAAHERGIVHRDLKPANVKITDSGAIKVLDFGLAKAVGDAGESADPAASPTITSGGTREGVILGTAAYMSPEQARGRLVDKRADIWAFGCVLYELLAGRRAFDGGSISDVLVAVLERQPDWEALPAGTPARADPRLRHRKSRAAAGDGRRHIAGVVSNRRRDRVHRDEAALRHDRPHDRRARKTRRRGLPAGQDAVLQRLPIVVPRRASARRSGARRIAARVALDRGPGRRGALSEDSRPAARHAPARRRLVARRHVAPGRRGRPIVGHRDG